MLEPLLPLFVEEPVLPEFTAELARITAGTSIPIATGERLYSRREFKTALDAGIAVAQPDASHAGGISEVRRIAALAEMYDVQIAPHCPLGPISLAACLQIGFATPNYLIQEQSLGLHSHHNQPGLDYLLDTGVFTLTDGHIARPLSARTGHRHRREGGSIRCRTGPSLPFTGVAAHRRIVRGVVTRPWPGLPQGPGVFDLRPVSW